MVDVIELITQFGFGKFNIIIEFWVVIIDVLKFPSIVSVKFVGNALVAKY